MLVFWIIFHFIIASILVIDLCVLNRGERQLTSRKALIWTCGWIALACGFGAGLWSWQGPSQAMSFATGYLIELSLSVDNLFVFLALFASFSVPRAYQHKVLVWGILGALSMRAVIILAGTSLIHHFHWLAYLFGGFLVFMGIRFVGNQKATTLRGSLLLRTIQRWLPFCSEYQEDRLVVRKQGPWIGTPLLLVLLSVEVTDLLFALDSIPAILAVSRDPFIVYTSNVFAILGLRSLYFALATMMDLFRYLRYGVAAVLLFIGGKMLLAGVYPVPVETALGTVAGIFVVSVLVSILHPAHPAQARAGKVAS